MDEPTNHLDLATREALSMALNEFEGSVMLVSHDRALLRAVCDEFWMVSRGGVEPFDGDLDDYQRYLLEEAKRLRAQAVADAQQQEPIQAKAAPLPAVAKPAPAKVNNNQVRQWQKSLTQLESEMAALTQEQTELQLAMGQTTQASDLATQGKRLKEIETLNEALEVRWLELTTQLEAVN
jgi:ATP-binding cassette subfamily F protein 3